MSDEAKKALLEKYPALTATFLRGQFSGQLTSIYKSMKKGEHADKVEQFKNAMNAGDISFPEKLTRQQAKKLNELSIKVPDHLQPKAEDAAEDAGEADEAVTATVPETEAVTE